MIDSKTGKRRQVCRQCRALHGPKDCPRVVRIPILTMREVNVRKKLEAQEGRQLDWDEVFELSGGRYPKYVEVG